MHMRPISSPNLDSSSLSRISKVLSTTSVQALARHAGLDHTTFSQRLLSSFPSTCSLLVEHQLRKSKASNKDGVGDGVGSYGKGFGSLSEGQEVPLSRAREYSASFMRDLRNR